MDVTTATQFAPRAVQVPKGTNYQPSKAEKVGQEFESMFIHQMLELMSQDVKAPDIYNGGAAEDVFRSMMNEKIADEVTKGGGIGVAKVITDQIKRYEEAQNR